MRFSRSSIAIWCFVTAYSIIIFVSNAIIDEESETQWQQELIEYNSLFGRCLWL